MVIQTKKFSIEDKQRKGSNRIRGTEDENKSRSGVVPSERRKYPRLNVDLPIQYRIDPSSNRNGRAMNLSEGGMLVHSSHQLEIGQRLRSKLVFIFDSEIDTIETEAEVVWRDIYFNKAWGDHRCGLRFLGISAKDQNRLKDFLTSLS